MKRSRDEFDEGSLSPAPQQESSASPESSSSPVKIVRQETAPPAEVMRCSLPGHAALSFSAYDEYESHYNLAHLWKCTVCGRNFPSEHYLGLHITEHHDSMAQIQKERGEKIYSCFVEDCDRKCSAPEKRRMHLIDKHLFPKDYHFGIIRTGIDHRSSMLKSGRLRQQNRNHRRHEKPTVITQKKKPIESKKPNGEKIHEGDSSITSNQLAEDEEKMDEDHAALKSSALPPTTLQPDTEMDDLAGAMSSLKFIPTSVRFGRGGGYGKGRAGLSKT